MAYKEIYYKQIERASRNYRLSVLKRDYTGNAREIGDLASWSLEMSGGTDDVDAPILKTYCYFSMVDSRDKQNTTAIKFGAWEEFYTNDPTLYKVEVYEGDRLRWMGYITPDAWEEDLSYYGIISITARDNIGYLNELDFDYSGRYITLQQIVQQSMGKIGQNVGFSEDLYNVLAESGNLTKPITDVAFNCELWKEKTWYDALEESLKSLGLVLRFIDDATFAVSSMNAQNAAFIDYPRAQANAVFINNTGHRALVAAYKKITDKINYDFEGEKSVTELENNNLERPNYGKGRVLIGSGVEMMKAEGNFPVPFKAQDFNKYIYKQMYFPPKTSVTVSFQGAGVKFFIPTSGLTNYVSWSPAAITYRYALVWRGVDGSIKYYQGVSSGVHVWNTTQKVLTATSEASSSEQDLKLNGCTVSYTQMGNTVVTPDNYGTMEIRFYGVGASSSYYWGLINDIKFSSNVATAVESHTAKLVNTQSNAGNVAADRTSDIGQYVGSASNAPLVTNAFLLLDSNGSESGVTGWRFTDDDETRFSTFWELLHRWLFCFFSKPNNVLTGDIMEWDDNDPKFSDKYVFGGKEYILAGGRLNFINGHFESVTLREFVKYDDLYTDYPLSSIEVVAESESGTTSHLADGTTLVTVDFHDEDTLWFSLWTDGGWYRPRIIATLTNTSGKKTTRTLVTASNSEGVNGYEFSLNYDPLEDFFTNGYDKGTATVELKAAYQTGDGGGSTWEEIPLTGDYLVKIKLK